METSSPEFRGPREAAEWLSQRVGPRIGQLHECFPSVVDHGGNSGIWKATVLLSPQTKRHLLELTRADLLLVHAHAQQWGLSRVPDVPSQFHEVGDAEAVFVAAMRALEAAVDRGSPRPDGPDSEPYFFWWQGRRLELDICPAAWELLLVLWGKASVSVPDVGELLGKGRRLGYESLKPSVSRLNKAVGLANLPFTWTKKRGQNLITFDCPPFSSTVAE
jgi:hypothetical protein